VKRVLACWIVAVPLVLAAAPPVDVTHVLRDYLQFPVTGILDGKGQTDGMLARINLREEPGSRRVFVNDLSFANGLNSFQFDPDYATNGKFYTVHIGDPSLPGSPLPDSVSHPSLDVARYSTTAPGTTHGPVEREGYRSKIGDPNFLSRNGR